MDFHVRSLSMLFILIIFTIITVNGIYTKETVYKYRIKQFEVRLDHFSFANNNTFLIRYLVNDSYTADSHNGPILFYTGNEGDIELFAQNTGFIWETAPSLNALIIFAEHRYYGKSLPFGNNSYNSVEHLGYLTSEQALADYASLLNEINPINGKNHRPVIAIGGSYGGMLAAWFRMKYPHIVTGAIASSAPVLQFSTRCEVFNRIVTSVFTTAMNADCSANIKHSWNVMKKLADTAEGKITLTNKFKLCKNLTDIDELFDFLNDVYGNLAMVNYPYETSFLSPVPAYPVREFCRRLAVPYNETLVIDALNAALNIYTNYTGSLKCLDISSAYNNQEMGISGWDFQSCTEMVMPSCATAETMFPVSEWDFKRYSDKCFKKQGVRPLASMAEIMYGTQLIGASNIVFSNGLLDPWSGGGVLRSPNDKVKIVIIPEGAHHIDLRASTKDDPTTVVQARMIEVDAINEWIRE